MVKSLDVAGRYPEVAEATSFFLTEYKKKFGKKTLREISESLGAGGCTLSSWKSGRYKPGAVMIARMAETIDVDVDEMIKMLNGINCDIESNESKNYKACMELEKHNTKKY